jgi:quercetin dioxygenase-like cupin family protein
MIDALTRSLGFRVEMIRPADQPSEAVLSGHGVRIRLRPAATSDPAVAGAVTARLRLAIDPAPADLLGEIVLPNGTVVEVVDAAPAMVVPPLVDHGLIVTRVDRTSTDAWGTGRAGMQYRDLVPGRLGGRFIASHIRIPGGGPVPDYVHYHQVRFQMIFCVRGWTRLVYEDQGEPFVLRAGDCVLQPPTIRHRVLESGDDLEVVEIGCPAIHDTLGESGFDLPTGRMLPERDYGGQRFVHHVAATATWQPWRFAGFDARHIGFDAATDGLAEARVVRRSGTGDAAPWAHAGEFVFTMVLDGSVHLSADGHDEIVVERGDAVVVPAGVAHRWHDASDDVELLDVTLPADVPTAATAG